MVFPTKPIMASFHLQEPFRVPSLPGDTKTSVPRLQLGRGPRLVDVAVMAAIDKRHIARRSPDTEGAPGRK